MIHERRKAGKIRLAPQPRPAKLKKLYSAVSLPDAHLIRNLLEQAGIEAHVLNENAQGGVGQLPVMEACPQIWIADERDLERARQILEAFEHMPAIRSSLRCQQCSEDNPSHLPAVLELRIEPGLTVEPVLRLGSAPRGGVMIDPRSRAWSRREFLLGTRNAVASAAALGVVSHVPSIGYAADKQHMSAPVGLYFGEALGRYGFPAGHPLGVDRQGAFWREALARGLDRRVQMQAPRVASREEILRFHTEAHVQRVAQAQAQGLEFLDNGDTPVFPGRL